MQPMLPAEIANLDYVYAACMIRCLKPCADLVPVLLALVWIRSEDRDEDSRIDWNNLGRQPRNNDGHCKEPNS